MKLVVIASEFPPGPGGIGTHAHQLSRRLSACGWDVVVVAPLDYTRPDEVERFRAAQPFRVLAMPPRRRWAARVNDRIVGVRQALRDESPDVVLASGLPSVLLAAALGRDQRVVAIGHGSEFVVPNAAKRALARWAFDRASRVVCVSRFTERCARAAGVRVAIDVVPNGADAEAFGPRPEGVGGSFRVRFGLPLEHPLLLSVGHVTPRKAHDLVVRALPEIVERAGPTDYAIAGLPTDGARIEALAHELGVGPRVHVLGRIGADDLVAAYNAADVFVMPSRTATGDVEGFGIAAVEAALCTTPAVVAGGSGLEEAVVDGETGVVVPPDDPAAIAAATVRLLRDPEGRAEMGRRARARATEELTWERIGDRYDHLLRAVAAGGR